MAAKKQKENTRQEDARAQAESSRPYPVMHLSASYLYFQIMPPNYNFPERLASQSGRLPKPGTTQQGSAGDILHNSHRIPK